VASEGTAILSGLLAVQADSILAAYVTCGFSQLEREDIGEWSTLVLRRA
jgi:ribosomal protein L11 methyltransferase